MIDGERCWPLLNGCLIAEVWLAGFPEGPIAKRPIWVARLAECFQRAEGMDGRGRPAALSLLK